MNRREKLNKARSRAKALTVAAEVINKALCIIEMNTTNNFVKKIGLFHKVNYIQGKIDRIIHTPSKVFRANGKVDKRRYKRFVLGKGKVIRINASGQSNPVIISINEMG